MICVERLVFYYLGYLPRRLSVCMYVCLSICRQLYVKTTERIFVKLYHRCICGQGRTDWILEVIRFRTRIQEFFEGFFTVESWVIFSQFVSGKADQILMETVPWTRKFRKILDVIRIWSPDRDAGYGLRMRLGRGMRFSNAVIIYKQCTTRRLTGQTNSDTELKTDVNLSSMQLTLNWSGEESLSCWRSASGAPAHIR